MFNQLGVDHGITDGAVNAMAGDSKGFMWFGTINGLNKYDAKRVFVYKNVPNDSTSLSNNYVLSLCVSADGKLWVGTNSGLCLYDEVSDNFIRFYKNSDDPYSLCHNKINFLLNDTRGNLWVGTENGLNLWLKDKKKFFRFINSSDNDGPLLSRSVNTMGEDSHGNIWIASCHGITKLEFTDTAHYKFSHYPFLNKIDPIKAEVVDDHKGYLWIGVRFAGIYFFDLKKNRFLRPNESPYSLNFKDETDVRALRRGSNNEIWIGTNHGIYQYLPEEKTQALFNNDPNNELTICNDLIQSIYVDRVGTLWIGSYFEGVSYCNPNYCNFSQFVLDKEQMQLIKKGSILFEDAHRKLWIGTGDKGLFHLDRSSGIIEQYSNQPGNNKSLSHDNIKSLLEDADKGIWVGTLKGLNYFNYRTKTFTCWQHKKGYSNSIVSDRIYDIQRDKNGMLWIAAAPGGIAQFNPQTKTFRNYPCSSNQPNALPFSSATCLLFDKGDTLWVGSFSGICCKLPAKDIFLSYPIGNSLGKLMVNVHIIYQDSKKRLWIGLRANGLALLDRAKKRFVPVFLSNKKDLSVFDIKEDKSGKLWLNTSDYLYKYDPETNVCQNFNHTDGIVLRRYVNRSIYEDSEGYFWLIGKNGIIHFSPDRIKENLEPPKVVFSRLLLFGKEIATNGKDGLLQGHISLTKTLKFKYDQNVFTIDFAVLNYVKSVKNTYAYKLEGFDEDWNYTSEPSASYMNLHPGHYKLAIKGANNSGVWSKQPVYMDIYVLPPPWKTWWAYLGYASVLISLLLVWFKYTKERIRLKHDVEMKQNEARQQMEIHHSKLRFFTNVAHEIRTPLTLIINPLEELCEAPQNSPLVNDRLSLIKQNSNRLLRLVNQLLDFEKHETNKIELSVAEGNLVRFLNEIYLAFKQLAQSRKITLNFTHETDEVLLWFDREELEKVFYNLLSNAFKFTPDGGHISIDICADDHNKDCIKVAITDSGKGIGPHDLEKIFDHYYQADKGLQYGLGFGIGLALSRNIVELHGGKIWFESSQTTKTCSGKTTCNLVLPLGHSHFKPDQIDVNYLNSDDVNSYFLSLEPVTSIDVDPQKDRHLILVVEDNFDIRRLLKERLEKIFDIIEAPDGEEGWLLASNELPDIIISDVLMPKLNGLELTARIKSDERTSHIPVILLTARNTVIHQLEGYRTGADDYLTKPFHVNILLAKIKNLLAGRELLKQKYSRVISLEPQPCSEVNQDEAFLRKLLELIEININDSNFVIDTILPEIGMSRSTLFRKLKMLTDITMGDMIRSVRLKKAAMLLKEQKMTIAEVAFAVGFEDPKHFSKLFKMQFGTNPSEYSKTATHQKN